MPRPAYVVTLVIRPDDGDDHPATWDWTALMGTARPATVLLVTEATDPDPDPED